EQNELIGNQFQGIVLEISLQLFWVRLLAARCWVLGGLVWLLGLSGIGVAARSVHKRITERSQADEVLRESEERYRSIIDNSVDGIYVLDETGLIIEWNRGVEEITLLKKDCVLGRPVWDIYYEFMPAEAKTPDARARLQAMVLESMSTRVYRQALWETSIQCPDGTRKVIQSSNFPIATGKRYMHGIITRDITERKRAQEALQESEEKLRGIIEGSIDGIYLVNEQGIIVTWNQGAESLTMLPKDRALGRPIWDIFFEFMPDAKKTPEMYERLKLIVLDSLQTGQSPSLNRLNEQVIQRPDQTERIIQEYSFPIRTDRGFMFGTISRDVTEKKQMEEERARTQKMEAIGTLAGGIAHDFNNILAAIMGYTEMTLFDLPEHVPARNNLEQVLKSANRAKGLVQQILAFSRKAEEEKKPFQLAVIVKEALTMLRATLPTTIDIRQNIASDAWVMANPTQMHQVLMNLCTNAAHAMREHGGTLDVALSEVAVDAGTAGEYHDLSPGLYVKLSITDTGTGIAPTIIYRIFDPFFTTKGVGEGTGMGLAVVVGIVKSHGGDITVASKVGKGTTFQVVLPIVEAKAQEGKETVQPLLTGTENILFVDDEELLVDIGKKLLESLGYRVIATRSSSDALEVFQKEPDKFDLVITDYTMPHMTGYDLARKLMEIRPGVPIILCTGYSETISPEKAKAIGIKEFIMKPLNRNAMAETIRRVLNNKSA
ncbi:MAG: PAS domain S-box protein, partial [Proteobacteria bacterium]|nr:PAS domain S-box protein [Pseudomonadota bacterium]